jgi:hypothetical protein
MRFKLLMLIATFSLVALASASADSTESAVWADRKLVHFSPPAYNGGPANSCDQIIDRLKFVLLRLGARASDLNVEANRCYAIPGLGVDMSFSVLVPTEQTGKNATGAPAEASWQLVQLKPLDPLQDCAYLEYVTMKVLPLFSTRQVKLIPKADCSKYGVGLSAEVLKPTQQLAASP